MNRREFLIDGAAGAASVALGGCAGLCGCDSAKFKLALAGITLISYKKVDDALAFCEQHGFHYFCVKNFHLPFGATPAEMAIFRCKCADHGVTPYGVGPIYICSEAEAVRMFKYAAAFGVKLMVGVPGVKTGPKWADIHSDRRMCEVCSKLADEFDIKFAIHNHGRNPNTGNPNLYPAVPEIYEMIRDLSPRMGLCVDWAYTYADGLDCAEVVRKYRDRIFDGHIRCISNPKNGSSGVNPAKRCFDYDSIFTALKEVGYDGCLGLELANAFPDNPQWIDESREYFTRLMA